VVLTGATSGIGRATAVRLAPRSGHLLLHGPEPAEEVESFLGELAASAPRTRIDYLAGDFHFLEQVVALAAAVEARTDRVDVLINNAGRPGAPRRMLTHDRHEATLQVNYLAPVLLTSRLLGGRSPVGRILNVASATHFSAELRIDDLELERHPYESSAAYARSKLALVTYSCWLAGRAGDTEVVSAHPGVISTRLLHAMFSVGGASPESAASNLIEVMARHGDSGTYYDERQPVAPHRSATDPATQERLHDVTERWLSPFLQD
jgi:NAD(P)-dependent dehydrogenase (short-subunit alcohol dehydrogenase family)